MSNNIRISNQIFYEDELYHHGVPGMKWGRHLFGRINSSFKNRSSKSSNTQSESQPKVKRLKKNSYKKMTDEELDKAIERLKKEQTYKSLIGDDRKTTNDNRNNNNNNNNGGKKEDGFVRKLINKSKDSTIDAITTASKNAGQAYLEKKLKDKLGLNTKSEHDRLKEQSDIATYKANIARQKAAEEAARNASRSAEEASYKQKVADFMKSYYSNKTSAILGLPGPGAGSTHHRRSS